MMDSRRTGVAVTTRGLLALALAVAATTSRAETMGEFANRSLKLWSGQIESACGSYKGGTDERRRCMYLVSVAFLRQHHATCAALPETLISGCSMAELTIERTPERVKRR